MPWVPELFSAPVLARLQEKWQRDRLLSVPYFDGLTAGEPDALVESFAGAPVLHDPVRGRIKGVRAFEVFVTDMNARLAQRNASIEDVHYVITEPRAFEEVVLHLDGEPGESTSRSGSSPITGRTGGSTSCGSTPAAGR